MEELIHMAQNMMRQMNVDMTSGDNYRLVFESGGQRLRIQQRNGVITTQFKGGYYSRDIWLRPSDERVSRTAAV